MWDVPAKDKPKAIQRSFFPELTDEERFVVQLLGAHPEGFHINALAVETGMPINRLSATLFELELRGIVRPLAGNCFKVIS